jgi:hypothetical protein
VANRYDSSPKYSQFNILIFNDCGVFQCKFRLKPSARSGGA